MENLLRVGSLVYLVNFTLAFKGFLVSLLLPIHVTLVCKNIFRDKHARLPSRNVSDEKKSSVRFRLGPNQRNSGPVRTIKTPLTTKI